MNVSNRDNSKRNVLTLSRPIRDARAPGEVFRALTLRAAIIEFPVLHQKLIWQAANDGFLHPIRPQGRILYPEWELRELAERVMRLYRAGSEFGTRAA